MKEISHRALKFLILTALITAAYTNGDSKNSPDNLTPAPPTENKNVAIQRSVNPPTLDTRDCQIMPKDCALKVYHLTVKEALTSKEYSATLHILKEDINFQEVNSQTNIRFTLLVYLSSMIPTETYTFISMVPFKGKDPIELVRSNFGAVFAKFFWEHVRDTGAQLQAPGVSTGFITLPRNLAAAGANPNQTIYEDPLGMAFLIKERNQTKKDNLLTLYRFEVIESEPDTYEYGLFFMLLVISLLLNMAMIVISILIATQKNIKKEHVGFLIPYFFELIVLVRYLIFYSSTLGALHFLALKMVIIVFAEFCSFDKYATTVKNRIRKRKAAYQFLTNMSLMATVGFLIASFMMDMVPYLPFFLLLSSLGFFIDALVIQTYDVFLTFYIYMAICFPDYYIIYAQFYTSLTDRQKITPRRYFTFTLAVFFCSLLVACGVWMQYSGQHAADMKRLEVIEKKWKGLGVVKKNEIVETG